MKFFVVPDSSERWQTVMSLSGRLVLPLTLAIAGSFHFLILPRKMSAIVAPSSLRPLSMPLDVVGDRHRAEHGRDVDGVALLLGGRLLLGLHRRVGGAEVDGAGRELGDAAARADGLVVDRGARRVLEARGPLGVDRRREGRAGAVDRAALLGAARRAGAAARAPPDGLSSLLPHAARPSASAAADPAASHWLDLTSEHLIGFVALVRPQASNARPCSLLPTRGWDVKSV